MTTQQTTDLPAGPELDLAVARACGITFYESRRHALSMAKDGERGHWIHSSGFVEYIIGGSSEVEKCWSPSTNIADAFEALGVMRRHPEAYWLSGLTLRGAHSDEYICMLGDRNSGYACSGTAPTPELAISRAIVRAGKGGGG
jgi:hypothetical protein